MCHWRRTRQGHVNSDLEEDELHQHLDVRVSGEPRSTGRSESQRGGINQLVRIAHGVAASSRSRSSKASKPDEAGDNIQSLPNELLEYVFLLAIATSFPIEDPNWPLSPLFSKRSYGNRHSPSNSTSGIPQVDASSGRSTSRASQRQQVQDVTVALANAPHLLPTTLSQTCRRFRAVLRNAPHLWSFINVTRTTSMPVQQVLQPRQIIGWLPLYLSRSRDANLHITLDTTKFASFNAPPSHCLSPSSTALVHPDSILALLLSKLQRWASLTILASHVGSPTISPLLQSLSPLQNSNLRRFRIAADIWRPGIVGYGSQPPPLFVGGCPRLESVVLDGIHLDWKSCFSFGSPGTPGLFAHLKNLELQFVGNHFPRFEQFTQLLELGSPRLERLVVRDDLEEALRALNPPPLPYFEGIDEDGPDSPHNHPPRTPDSPELSVASGSTGRSSGSGRSVSSRSPASGYIEGLHLTLPPATHYHSQPPSGRGSRGRSNSTSSSSSGSSSPPTSPYYQQFARVHRPHRPRQERQFRKIEMPFLKHLEVHAYNPSTAAGAGRRSSIASRGSGSGREATSRGSNSINEAPEHTSFARFLYLFATPSLRTLAISGLGYDQWIDIAEMLGLPRDFDRVLEGQSRPQSKTSSHRGSSRSVGGNMRECASGHAQSSASSRDSVHGGEGSGRSFPFLRVLKVDLVDR